MPRVHADALLEAVAATGRRVNLETHPLFVPNRQPADRCRSGLG